MAIKLASRAHSASIQLSLLLPLHASHSSLKPMVLGPTQLYLSLPMTFSSGGFSPMLSNAPSLSCTYVPSTVMPRRHRMWCRRAGGCGLPSKPPLSHAMGREMNLSVVWKEPSRLNPINLSTQLSLQLPVSPSASSSICPKKRPHKSTILLELSFIPHKMKSLPVQSTSSSSHCTKNNSGSSDGRSSNSDTGDNNEETSQLAVTYKWPISPAPPRPQATSHALSKEEDDSFYVCRIKEEDPNSTKKKECPH